MNSLDRCSRTQWSSRGTLLARGRQQVLPASFSAASIIGPALQAASQSNLEAEIPWLFIGMVWLTVSIRTVEGHLSRASARLGTARRTDLAAVIEAR